jgi:outer membrane receptor protein involved in Fe transport
VTVTNTGTSVASHTLTSDTGNYTMPYLNPGVYRVSVKSPGFQEAVVGNVTLVVDQSVRVDAVLKPGAVTQVIEVRANVVSLDTDSAAISQLISDKQVVDLPLNGRNWTSLLFVSAGAVTVGSEMGSMRQGEGNGISINGGRPESNNYTLDGLGITDFSMNTPAVILSIDAIQEFKVQADTYSAEYGFSANQVNIISKPGTNGLHGSLFEFDRNDAFDARSPIAQPTLPKLRQNQFGFVVGGPVILPHLYDGRNKTFFMANYEGTRIRNGISEIGNVYTPAELSGNFSASGWPEPGTAACAAALALDQPCNPENPATGLAFTGDQIPSTLWSRQATVDLATNMFPAPNCSPANCSGDDLLLVATLPNTANQQTYRLDQDLGRFGKVFGRGTYATYTTTNLPSTYSVPIGETNFIETEKQWEVSHTITFHGNIVNNFRFGHLDAVANEGAPAPSAAQVSALGLTGIFTHFAALQESWSYLSFPGTGYSNFGGPVNAYTGSEIPSWEFADSLTMVKGKHTLTFGADYRHWVVNRNLDDDFFGDYNFVNDEITTNGVGCATVVCGTGNAVSDYLLGYYENVGGFIPGPLSPTTEAGNPQLHVYNYFAPFAQDDWKVTPRLTLNLGLRWDYRSVPYEEQNKFFWLDVNNPNGGLCFADKALLTDGVAPVGNGFFEYCGRRAPANPGLYKPFAPRIGFAYRPFGGEKTVVRGGYGIYYDSFEAREIDDSGDLYPFSVRDSLTPTTQPVTTAPKLTNQLFPPFTALTEVSPASATFIAVIESELPLNPYMQQWTLSVQRQLAKNTTLEVNYIGLKGTHLLTRHNIAQPYAPANPAICQANPANCPVSARLPYPNFTGFYINSDWHGNSDYNAGNIKLEHRTGQMAITTIFTWAKSLDDKSAAAGIGYDGGGYQGFMNNHNTGLDYGPSDFDVDHRFVASYVYNLPFGRGKHFLGNASKALDMALGGWELSGITTFQTGFPYSIDCTDLSGILDSQAQRCNRVPGVSITPAQRTTATWINTAAFSQPPIGVYGNTGRGILRQPGINNWDVGFFKNFNFTESKTLQLRFESFNTWNHPNYYVPLIGPTAGGGCNPDCTLSDKTFGAITIAAPGRIIQLGAKFIF